MTRNYHADDCTETQEDAGVSPTPLVSASTVSKERRPTYSIDQGRYNVLTEVAKKIGGASRGTPKNHLKGKLGEQAFIDYANIDARPNTQVYTDGGDGGVDVTFRGASIDVKTVGQHRLNPALTIGKHQPLRADYYVLASRIGPTECRLIGYAPRSIVATAPVFSDDCKPYRYVDQESLFPLPPI